MIPRQTAIFTGALFWGISLMLGCMIPLAQAVEICDVLVQKEQTSARTVYLTGGNAWELFERYLDEAKKQGIDVSLWKVRVVTSNGQERTEQSLGWYEMLTGQGARERWAGRLKKLNTAEDEAGYQNAERQKWDIVCYGGKGASGMAASSGGQTLAPGSTPPISRKVDVPLAARQHFDQGINHAAARRYDNAVGEFSEAIRVYPTYAAAYANRGIVHMQERRYNKALDDLTKARGLDPRDPFIRYNLAAVYTLQKQLDRATDELDAALAAGFKEYDALCKDADLKELRRSPDFYKTLEKHKVFKKCPTG